MLYQMNDIGPAVTSSSSSSSPRDAPPPSHDYVSATDDTDSSNSDSGKGPSEEGGDSQQLHDVSHDSQMAPQSSLAMTVFSNVAPSAAQKQQQQQQQRSSAHVNNKPSILKKSPHKTATAAAGANVTLRDVRRPPPPVHQRHSSLNQKKSVHFYKPFSQRQNQLESQQQQQQHATERCLPSTHGDRRGAKNSAAIVAPKALAEDLPYGHPHHMVTQLKHIANPLLPSPHVFRRPDDVESLDDDDVSDDAHSDDGSSTSGSYCMDTSLDSTRHGVMRLGSFRQTSADVIF